MTAFAIQPVSAFAIGLCLFVAAALLFRSEAWLSTKIIIQFLLTIALPILLILSLPLWALSRLADIETPVWQAVVAGAVIATGWLTTAIFAELGKQRNRREKTRDYHRALFSEIGNNLSNIWDIASIRAHGDGLIAKMRADPGFVPFIPREENDALFTILAPEIHILPRKTIDPIVAYYSQVRSIAALADDMRSEGFKAMPQDRRIAMYSDYIEMKIQALAFGKHANFVIDVYENGTIKADRAEAKRLSNQAKARSGPSQE